MPTCSCATAPTPPSRVPALVELRRGGEHGRRRLRIGRARARSSSPYVPRSECRDRCNAGRRTWRGSSAVQRPWRSSSGQVIAVGIFLTPGTIIRTIASPLGVLLVWAVMGAMAICGALCYGALAARYPAGRRRLRLPAGSVRAARGLPLRLEVPAGDGSRDHRRPRDRVRELRGLHRPARQRWRSRRGHRRHRGVRRRAHRWASGSACAC